MASPSEVKKVIGNPGELLMEDFFDNFILEDNMFFLPDESISVGLKVIPIVKESLEEKDFEKINSYLTALSKTIPDGTTIHLARPYIQSTNPILKPSGKEGYFDRNLKQHFSERPLTKEGFYIYLNFNFNFKRPKVPTNTWFMKVCSASNIVSTPFGNMSLHKKKVLQVVNGLVSQFNKIQGLTVKAMLKEELKQRVFEYFALTFDRKLSGWESNQALGDGTDGSIIRVGPYYVGFVRIQEPGDECHTSIPNLRGLHGFMTERLGVDLPFNHMVNTIIQIGNREVDLKDIDQKKAMIKSLGGKASQSNVIQWEGFMEFTQAVRKDDIQLARLYQNVMLWHPDYHVLENQINEVRGSYNDINNTIAVVENLNAATYFFNQSPGMAGHIVDGKLMPVNQAWCYADFSEEILSEKAGLIVGNRQRQLVHLDVRHPELENPHALVIGPSGSGKSFFCNNWIVQQHEMGFEQVIIDVGGSYKNIVEMLDGKYYEYDLTNPMRMNPFAVQPNNLGRFVLTEEKSIFLRSLLTLLWKDVSKGDYLTRNEDSVLAELLSIYYESVGVKHGAYPRLSFFVDFVEIFISTHKDDPKWHADLSLINMTSFLLNMRKFTKGIYSQMLNAETNEDISTFKFICFDMVGVQKDPVMYPVVALIIVELVLNKISRNPLQPKSLFMDEAWSFLGGSPLMSTFMENMFRTARKMNCSAILITQSLSELQSSKVGEAIRNNTAIKILLDHSSQTAQFENISSFLGFTTLDMEKLASIDKSAEWREFFIKRGAISQIYTLEVGPHSIAAFDSRAQSRAEIKELIRKYKRVDFALNEFVDKHY